MAGEVKITVNGRLRTVVAAPDTPLLYALANELLLQGPRDLFRASDQLRRHHAMFRRLFGETP